MNDSEMFGVRDSTSGEIGWCCVLGAAGELAGLALYRGERGYDTWRRLQSGEMEEDEAIYGEDALVLAFVDRDCVSATEQARLKRLQFSFRGRVEWPQLESHAHGRLPRPPNMAEVERMSQALLCASRIAVELRSNPEFVAPDSEGRLLVRSGREDQWIDERVAAPAAIEIPPREFDRMRAERARRNATRMPACWECDVIPMPLIIGGEKGGPYMPAAFILVDAEQGVAVQVDLDRADDVAAIIERQLMAGIERLRMLPESIRAARPSVVRAMRPLAEALSVRVEEVDDLPAVERLATRLGDLMARNRVPARR
jgi:hypothetical protein